MAIYRKVHIGVSDQLADIQFAYACMLVAASSGLEDAERAGVYILLCMCVYICICVCIYMCMCRYVYVYIRVWMYIYVHVYVYRYVYMHICV
jgi:hypothetical protein